MFDSFSCAPLRATLLGLVAIAWTATASPVVLAEEENPLEAKIFRALDGKAEIEFLETSLQDVAEFLSDFHRITIRFDKRALEDVGIGTDTLVTRRLKGVSLRSALTLMLRDLELAYTVEDGVVLITTPEEAESRLTTTLYPVADLVNGDPTTPYGTEDVDFDPIIELIEATVAPGSWDANGGPGAIDGFEKSGALVISQTQGVHRRIASLLAALHGLHSTPEKPKAQLGRKAERNKEVIVRVYRVNNIKKLTTGQPKDITQDRTSKPKIPSLPPDYVAAKRSADALAELIKKAIAPEEWGDGHMIRAIPGTLTIRQSRRVHGDIGRFLRKMVLLDGVTTLSPVAAVTPMRDGLPTTIRVGEIATEARIRKVLDEKTEFKLVETPLSEFVHFLREKHKLEIQIDSKELADVGLDVDIPLTGNLKGISLRSALRLVLRDVELTFVIRDEVLTITTPEEVEMALFTWVYPVKDLVVFEEDRVGVLYGEIDFDPLIELIEATIQPDSWDANGGPGAIDGFETPFVLVVAQTEEVHRQTARLLEKLRQTHSAQLKREAEAKKGEAKKAATSQPALEIYRVSIGVDRTVKPAAASKAEEEKPAAAQLGGSIGGGKFWGSPREMALRRLIALPDEASANQATQDLIAMIKSSIEPESWNGDEGKTIYTITGYLVVRHNVEVRRRIRVLLYHTGLWGDFRTLGGTAGSGGAGGMTYSGNFGAAF